MKDDFEHSIEQLLSNDLASADLAAFTAICEHFGWEIEKQHNSPDAMFWVFRLWLYDPLHGSGEEQRNRKGSEERAHLVEFDFHQFNYKVSPPAYGDDKSLEIIEKLKNRFPAELEKATQQLAKFKEDARKELETLDTLNETEREKWLKILSPGIARGEDIFPEHPQKDSSVNNSTTAPEEVATDSDQTVPPHLVVEANAEPVEISTRRKFAIALAMVLSAASVLFVATLLVVLGLLPYQVAVVLWTMALAFSGAVALLGQFNNVLSFVERFLLRNHK